ncbi:MAG: EAL domain-containing protein [Rhodocyclaceae bacterium]
MSLRARILWLVLAATFLPLLTVVWLLLQQRAVALEQARAQLVARADSVAQDLDDKVSGTAQLLFGLGRVPVLSSNDKTACSEFLATVLQEHPQYTGLLTIRSDGMLHCDSLRSGRKLDLNDRQYFKRAVISRRHVVEPVFGRLTGKGVLQIAYPVRDEGGDLKFVLLASLNLEAYGQSVTPSLPYPNMGLQIWDGNGNLILREPGGFTGPDARPQSTPEQDKLLLADKAGTVHTLGTGREARIWATATLPRSHDAGLRLGLSLPEVELYSQVDSQFKRTLLGMLAISAVLFLAAAALAEFAVRRQTARLMTAISHLDQGSFDTEIGPDYPRGELGKVMSALDRLARSLQTQHAELSRTHAALERQANYDNLTGLANRNLMHDRLDQALIYAHRAHRMAAVLMLDLDRFKTINDSLGHSKGDLLLQETGRRLSECVRPGDTVARMGGDEFVVVLSDMASLDDVQPVARKILHALAQPVTLEGHIINSSASIGMSVYPLDGDTGESLLRHADMAMYQAKDVGGNTIEQFTSAMTHSARARLQTEAGLRNALAHGEFLLHFQPIVDLKSGHITSVEALLRWQPPQGALVPPAQFIPIAEETGLIVPIGEWVLNEACRQAKRWQDQGHDTLQVAVNLSIRQFADPALVAMVKSALQTSGCNPACLQLEITESMVMQDAQGALSTMHQLTALGVQFSIDDFGTGYSSLSYLKRLPVRKLKIDRSFIGDIETDENDRAIVDAIQTLARKLTLRTVAEGVETEAQLEILRELGCDAYQGYLFSRPVPATDIARLLSSLPA